MTPTSALLSLTGAVPADPPDAGVPAHYGDPLREQRQLVEDAALVDRGNRGVVRVGGVDRLRWLHDLTTQALTGLSPGDGAEALVLSPRGHVEHALVLTDDGSATWADVEPATAPALLAFLHSMRFLLRVEPADVTDEWAVLYLGGPAADEVLRAALGVVPPARPLSSVALSSGGFVRRTGRPVPGADLLVPRSSVRDLAAAFCDVGATVSGVSAYEALRVAARRPRLGLDTDARTIPHEVGWLTTAVHLDKGCYRGQETVARVHNLGRPPRRLVLAHLDGSVDRLPAPGDPVTAVGRPVGMVGTAVRHHELGPLALLLVKRSVPRDVGPLLAGDVAAAIDPDDLAAAAAEPERPRQRPPLLAR